MLIVPCNALENMLQINRNEILLGSLKGQLRKDLDYKVSQKEVIWFFYHERLSPKQGCCTRTEGKNHEHFTVEETAKHGEDKSVLISALPPPGRSRLSPLCTFQRQTFLTVSPCKQKCKYYCDFLKNAIIMIALILPTHTNGNNNGSCYTTKR